MSKTGDVFLGEIERRDAVIAELLAALQDFMVNPEFQVAIGGNPIAVDAMMQRARAAIAKATP